MPIIWSQVLFYFCLLLKILNCFSLLILILSHIKSMLMLPLYHSFFILSFFTIWVIYILCLLIVTTPVLYFNLRFTAQRTKSFNKVSLNTFFKNFSFNLIRIIYDIKHPRFQTILFDRTSSYASYSASILWFLYKGL